MLGAAPTEHFGWLLGRGLAGWVDGGCVLALVLGYAGEGAVLYHALFVLLVSNVCV